MTNPCQTTERRRLCCEEKFDEGPRVPGEFWFTPEMDRRLLSDLESRVVERKAVNWTEIFSSDPQFCGPSGSENHHFLKEQLEFCKNMDIAHCVRMVEKQGTPVNDDTRRELGRAG